ncbi:class I SAM-dependent methyltransferase [Moorena sp. SIO4G3]|uniref:class I SAM-dependent DNA methyltransferase n=1 Tax=Moorena sp. SIO4G3 TaxID=2607821 RepID=UPI001429ADE9|nr:class I SAM-dependent methyltransferase [Moorena sp. SIO4G3]NEO80183.1 class I SAM-dependent methyltransferase [Moorena sp. SIO4G3]
MMQTEKSDCLEQVSSAQNNQDLSNVYDHWSQEYDESVISFGYNPPAVINGLVGRFVPSNDANILDAGVGTGMVGELLAILGYTNLVGIDLSLGMLERAGKKQVYQDLRQMVLGEPLAFTDNEFDAVVSAGTFSANHAPPESFDEFVRIVKPQGFIIVTIRVDVASYIDAIQAQIDTLEKEGWCQLVEHSKPFKNIPLVSETATIKAFVYRVLRDS